jgi:hypothetical protein
MNKRKRVCFYLDKNEYILKGTKSDCYKKIIDIDDVVDDMVDDVVDDMVDDISKFSITITPVDSSANK